MSTQAQSFFWMVLHDRVNTRNLLRRKTFHLDTYNCAVMDCQQEETLFHLLWGCPFAAFCWNFVCPNRNVALSVLQTVEDMKQTLALPFAMDIYYFGFLGHLDNQKQLDIPTNPPFISKLERHLLHGAQFVKIQNEEEVLHFVSIMAGLCIVIFSVFSFLFFYFSLFGLFRQLLFYFILGSFFVPLAYLKPVRPALWAFYLFYKNCSGDFPYCVQ